MQANLQQFDTATQRTAPGEQESVFTGEIRADILETGIRHITGFYEYILIEITASGLTMCPYEDPDNPQAMSQTVSFPANDWDDFEFSHATRYTVAVDPYHDLYQTFTQNEFGETVSLTLETPSPDSNWEALQSHPLTNRNDETADATATGFDVLSISDVEFDVLREPAYDALSVNQLSFHSSWTIESMHELKTWFSNHGDGADETLALVCVTDGRDRADEYVFSVTEVDRESFESTGESIVLTGDSLISQDNDGIADVIVGETRNRPPVDVEVQFPEAHENATAVSYGFYDYDALASLSKHVLKDSLTEGEYEFEVTTEFPIRATHELSSSVDGSDVDSVVELLLAPVVSP